MADHLRAIIRGEIASVVRLEIPPAPSAQATVLPPLKAGTGSRPPSARRASIPLVQYKATNQSVPLQRFLQRESDSRRGKGLPALDLTRFSSPPNSTAHQSPAVRRFLTDSGLISTNSDGSRLRCMAEAITYTICGYADSVTAQALIERAAQAIDIILQIFPENEWTWELGSNGSAGEYLPSFIGADRDALIHARDSLTRASTGWNAMQESGALAAMSLVLGSSYSLACLLPEVLGEAGQMAEAPAPDDIERAYPGVRVEWKRCGYGGQEVTFGNTVCIALKHLHYHGTAPTKPDFLPLDDLSRLIPSSAQVRERIRSIATRLTPSCHLQTLRDKAEGFLLDAGMGAPINVEDSDSESEIIFEGPPLIEASSATSRSGGAHSLSSGSSSSSSLSSSSASSSFPPSPSSPSSSSPSPLSSSPSSTPPTTSIAPTRSAAASSSAPAPAHIAYREEGAAEAKAEAEAERERRRRGGTPPAQLPSASQDAETNF